MVTINPLSELGINLEWESRTLTLIIPLRKRTSDECHTAF